MDIRRALTALFCVPALLVLVQCSQPAPEVAAPAAPARGNEIRLTGAGNSYAGFSKVGTMVLRHLKREFPERDMWMDYHEAGTRFRDGMIALGNGKADIVFANTPHLVDMAYRGVGIFEAPVPLRGIGGYPSDDWINFVVDPALGVKSFADIREKRVGLKISTGKLDGDNVHPFLIMELLKRHGITLEEFKSWGGEILGVGIGGARNAYLSGESNAVFYESGYDARWDEQIKKRPMQFISIDPAVAKQMEAEYGWPSNEVRANYYPGQPEEFLALDFGTWAIAVREDLDDEVAYQIARIFIEGLDQQLPPPGVKPGMEKVSGGFGGLAVEFVPSEMIKLPVPLHPGAIRYYREKGLLPATTE